MGGSTDGQKFSITDDGTIVRGRKCPNCGKELISEGAYCEYCGAKIKGTPSSSAPKKSGSKVVLWLFLMAVLIAATIGIIAALTTSNNNYYHEVGNENRITEDSVWPEYQECPEEQIYMESYFARILAEEEKSIPYGYVDLGLPSGTLWKNENEDGFFSDDDARDAYGNQLPTKKQWDELGSYCNWTWNGNGYWVENNNHAIFLPAAYPCAEEYEIVRHIGSYLSSDVDPERSSPWILYFDGESLAGSYDYASYYGSYLVRLVYSN